MGESLKSCLLHNKSLLKFFRKSIALLFVRRLIVENNQCPSSILGKILFKMQFLFVAAPCFMLNFLHLEYLNYHAPVLIFCYYPQHSAAEETLDSLYNITDILASGVQGVRLGSVAILPASDNWRLYSVRLGQEEELPGLPKESCGLRQ